MVGQWRNKKGAGPKSDTKESGVGGDGAAIANIEIGQAVKCVGPVFQLSDSQIVVGGYCLRATFF